MFTTDRVSVDTDKTGYPVTVFHVCGNSGRLQYLLQHRDCCEGLVLYVLMLAMVKIILQLFCLDNAY